jgi:hypothetical protein
MGNEKIIAFKIDVSGVSNEDNALAKLDLQIKNIKKEITELEKSARKGIASNEQIRQLAAYNKELGNMQTRQKDLTKVANTAKDSLTRMRAELIRLKADYANGSAELRTSLIPQISKLNNEVSKAEQAIGVHSRGVGNYRGAILDAGKQLLGFGGYVALAATALNKLKEAFLDTETGTKVIKQWTEGIKTYFQNILKGNIQMAGINAAAAMEVAKEMDKIRQGDRADLVNIAKLETELHELRLKGADVTKSISEQLRFQVLADEKENELIDYKIKDKEEELRIVQTMLVFREKDTTLLNQQAQLEADIINIKGEKSLRIASKMSALREKEGKEIEANNAKIIEGQQKLQEEVDKFQKEQEEKAKKRVEDELKRKAEEGEMLWKFQTDLGKQLFQENQRQAEEVWNAMLARDEAEIEAAKKKEDTIMQFKQAGLEGIQMGVEAAFDARKSRMNAEREAELSNENLTESQRMAIRKKYAKEQQKLDVKQAIINGALAVGRAAMNAWPVPAIPMMLLAGLQTAFQVATIKAQKYATGGKIKGGMPINTGTKDNRLIAVNETETVLTDKHVAMLGGSATMRKIRVPGYASGGFIGTQAPEIPGAGFDYQQLARLMNSIEVRLDINKVNSAQREIAIVTEPNRI